MNGEFIKENHVLQTIYLENRHNFDVIQPNGSFWQQLWAKTHWWHEAPNKELLCRIAFVCLHVAVFFWDGATLNALFTSFSFACVFVCVLACMCVCVCVLSPLPAAWRECKKGVRLSAALRVSDRSFRENTAAEIVLSHGVAPQQTPLPHLTLTLVVFNPWAWNEAEKKPFGISLCGTLTQKAEWSPPSCRGQHFAIYWR